MKIQIIDDSGQVFAERSMPQLPNSSNLPDEYLSTIERNARIVAGNKQMLMSLIATLQDATIIDENGLNESILEVKVGIATLLAMYEKNADGVKMGGMGKAAFSIAKQVAGKAEPIPIDVERLGEIMKAFGEGNADLIPGINDYFNLIANQIKQKFDKNGK